MLGRAHLYAGLEGEAGNHEEQDGDNVVLERGPVTDLEGSHKGTHQHEEDGAGAEDGASHQHSLQGKEGRKGVPSLSSFIIISH